MKPLLKMQVDEHVNNIRRREKKEEKKRKKEEKLKEEMEGQEFSNEQIVCQNTMAENS